MDEDRLKRLYWMVGVSIVLILLAKWMLLSTAKTTGKAYVDRKEAARAAASAAAAPPPPPEPAPPAYDLYVPPTPDVPPPPAAAPASGVQ